MILEKTKFSISKQVVNPWWQFKNVKKKISAGIFGIFKCLLPPRSYGRLLENPKTGASRDLFLPESDFKTSSTVNVPKTHPDFGGLETNQRH